MSDSKRDYERGYHDAREGKENKGSVGLRAFGAILPGKNSADSADYQKGYHEGKEDRERNK